MGYEFIMMRTECFNRGVLIRALLLFTLFACLIAPLNASEVLMDDGTVMDIEEESLAEWFLTCFEALMQNQGQGGYVIFTPELEPVTGWIAPGTPQDFLVNIPPSTLGIPEVLPTEILMLLCAKAGDKSSVAELKEWGRENPVGVMVVLFKSYGQVTLETPEYAYARHQLSLKAGALGLNMDEMFALFEAEGLSEEEVIRQVAEGRDARETVLEALSLRNKVYRNEDDGRITAVLIVIILVLAGGIAVTLRRALRGEDARKEEEEETDEK